MVFLCAFIQTTQARVHSHQQATAKLGEGSRASYRLHYTISLSVVGERSGLAASRKSCCSEFRGSDIFHAPEELVPHPHPVTSQDRAHI